VLPRAGHTKWLQGPLAECWCLDAVFGGGSVARRVVLEATAACMVAWFKQQLTEPPAGGKPTADPLASVDMPARPAEVRVAAAAVYGEARAAAAPGEDGGAPGSPGAGPGLPAPLAPWLGGFVDSGDFKFAAKGGAVTAHPL
jgi:hypothetical protein